jgi:hypothetical protein
MCVCVWVGGVVQWSRKSSLRLSGPYRGYWRCSRPPTWRSTTPATARRPETVLGKHLCMPPTKGLYRLSNFYAPPRAKARWPSGLRRRFQVPVRKGKGSNPFLVKLFFVFPRVPRTGRTHAVMAGDASTLRKTPFFGLRLFGGTGAGSTWRRVSGTNHSVGGLSTSSGGSSSDMAVPGFHHLALSMDHTASGAATGPDELVDAAAAMLLAAEDDIDAPDEWPTLLAAGVAASPGLDGPAPLPRRNSFHDLTVEEAALAPLNRRASSRALPTTPRTPAPIPMPSGAASTTSSAVDRLEAFEDTVDATLAAIPQLRRRPGLRAAARSVVAAQRLAGLRKALDVPPHSPGTPQGSGPSGATTAPTAVAVLSLVVNAAGHAVVASGTVDARLDTLVGEGDPSAQEMYDFLSTYRYYLAGPDLLAKLIARHRQPSAMVLPAFVFRDLDGDEVELPRAPSRPVSTFLPAAAEHSSIITSGSLGPAALGRSRPSTVTSSLGALAPSSPPALAPLGTAAAAGTLSRSPRPGALDVGPSGGSPAAALASGGTDDIVLRRAAATGAAAGATMMSPRASVVDMDAALHSWVAGRASVALSEAEVCAVRRLRVLNVLRAWVTRHPEDFHTDHPTGAADQDALAARVAAFVTTDVLPNESEARFGRSILELLRQHASARHTSQPRRPVTSSVADAFEGDPARALAAPVPGPSRTAALLLQKPQAVAQQLTLIERELFRRVFQSELAMQPWAKPDRAARAPNLLRFIHWFNHVSSWVTTEVCHGASVKQRVAIVRVFLEVARYCLHHHNFNGVFEIVVGLMASPVARLKKTWKAMPSKAVEVRGDARGCSHIHAPDPFPSRPGRARTDVGGPVPPGRATGQLCRLPPDAQDGRVRPRLPPVACFYPLTLRVCAYARVHMYIYVCLYVWWVALCVSACVDLGVLVQVPGHSVCRHAHVGPDLRRGRVAVRVGGRAGQLLQVSLDWQDPERRALLPARGLCVCRGRGRAGVARPRHTERTHRRTHPPLPRPRAPPRGVSRPTHAHVRHPSPRSPLCVCIL